MGEKRSVFETIRFADGGFAVLQRTERWWILHRRVGVRVVVTKHRTRADAVAAASDFLEERS